MMLGAHVALLQSANSEAVKGEADFSYAWAGHRHMTDFRPIALVDALHLSSVRRRE